MKPTSTTAPQSAPLRYTPSLEHVEQDEPKAEQSLRESMHKIQETTFEDYGHAVRGVHAKSHGLIEGQLEVLGGLPETLAQGLFATAHTYPVILRFSTNPGDVLDDSITVPRGVAIKVMGVTGKRVAGSEGDSTQDFVMVNGPAFAVAKTADFVKNVKLLAATTDTGQAWKKAFSAVLRGAEVALEAVGGQSAALKALGGHPQTHPLGERYFTQVPFRYGDYVAKLSLVPVSPPLTALSGARVDASGRPNALREEINDFFAGNDAEWELCVQLRTNAESMPIEDASVVWPEAESPYVPVARIRAPRQPAWSEARARQVDDALSFSPWHALAAHQPLGSINRARREAYRQSAGFRAARNGCPIGEPQAALALSQSPATTYGSAPGREGRRPHTPDAPTS